MLIRNPGISNAIVMPIRIFASVFSGTQRHSIFPAIEMTTTARAILGKCDKRNAADAGFTLGRPRIGNHQQCHDGDTNQNELQPEGKRGSERLA